MEWLIECAFFCAFLNVPPAPDATFAAALLTSFNVFSAFLFTVDSPSSNILFALPISIGEVTADRACAAFSAALARSMVPIGDAARSNKSITLADLRDFSSSSFEGIVSSLAVFSAAGVAFVVALYSSSSYLKGKRERGGGDEVIVAVVVVVVVVFAATPKSSTP
jgi:hypothetical protein